MAIIKFITKNAAGSSYGGKYQDDWAIHDVVGYIYDVKHGGYKTQGYIGGWAVDSNHAVYEMELLSRLHHKNNGVRLRHWEITFSETDWDRIRQSLPNMEEALVLYRLGLEFSKYYANRYQVVFAVHLDSRPGHLHFVSNTVSYVDGRKYGGTKEEYYAYEQYAKSIGAKYGFPIFVTSDHSATKHYHRYD